MTKIRGVMRFEMHLPMPQSLDGAPATFRAIAYSLVFSPLFLILCLPKLFPKVYLVNPRGDFKFISLFLNFRRQEADFSQPLTSFQ